MKVSELVRYMSPQQKIILWSDRFVETMFSGTVEEMSETVLSQDVEHIGGCYMPNVIKIVIA